MSRSPSTRTAKKARRRNRSARQSRRGAALVEFALVVPLFFLFLMASFEMGWLHVMRHTADNAAYEAARHAMVPGATAAEAQARASSILGAVGARGATVSIDPPTLTTETESITVTVQIPMNQNALVVPRFTRNRVLEESSTLKTERGNTQ